MKLERKRGFTLIELLVVISIIAMLMAIMMPALGRVREIARETVCKSNLKQWGQIFHTYAASNDGKFMLNKFGSGQPGAGTWIVPLSDYYDGGTGGNAEKLAICPVTRKTAAEGEGEPAKMVWDTTIDGKYYRNTYSINNAIYVKSSESKNWGKLGQKQEDMIPMFLEGWRWGGGFGTRSDAAPDDKDKLYDGTGRFCIDRHRLAVNVCFMDGHVERVGLKGLWDLKWHRQYSLTDPLPTWPDWLKSAKD